MQLPKNLNELSESLSFLYHCFFKLICIFILIDLKHLNIVLSKINRLTGKCCPAESDTA